MYFTPYHYGAIAIIVFFFLFFLIVSMRERRLGVFLTLFGLNIFVMAVLLIFALLNIDQFTKKAQISDLNYERVLRNETIMFFGRIRNVGEFEISSCTLNIRLTNAPADQGLIDGSIFRQQGFFERLKNRPETRGIAQMDFKIGQNLRPGESRPFSVSMPFPANFRMPSHHHKLSCH